MMAKARAADILRFKVAVGLWRSVVGWICDETGSIGGSAENERALDLPTMSESLRSNPING